MIPSVIIGLGNPDPQYEKTYHNVGLLFIDYLEKEFGRKPPLHKLKKLVKSDVYMNRSGAFTLETLKRAKAKPASLLVVHDDTDIALGTYKVSFGRGSGGHKGIENIIRALKTKEFTRLRIGIRSTRNRKKAADFVLKNLPKAHMTELTKTFRAAAKALALTE